MESQPITLISFTEKMNTEITEDTGFGQGQEMCLKNNYK